MPKINKRMCTMAKLSKDAYYFPHFYNARHDRKIKRLRRDLGIEGYGIFFMLLEVLREQTDLKYPFQDIDLLAEEFGTSSAKIETVILKYELFSIDAQEMFFSSNMIIYLQPYLEKSERARIAATIRWDKYKSLMNTNADANAYANADAKNENAYASKVKYSKRELLNVSSKVTPEKFYNDNFSLITPFIADQIKNYIDDGIEPDMITAIMEISVINNKKSWNYVKSVIEDKLSNGITTLEQFEAYENHRKNIKTESISELYTEVDA
jgi:DnaD/phage-associated family protein